MHKSELNLLPRWKCHKIVGAAKIFEIRYLPPSVSDPAQMEPVGLVLRLSEEANPILLAVSNGWRARFKPEVGGYLVAYEDGYTSYSPAKAFEEGYTLLDESLEELKEDLVKGFEPEGGWPEPESQNEAHSIFLNLKKIILTPAGEIKQVEITQYPEGQINPEGCIQMTKEQALTLAAEIRRRFE